MLRATLAAVTVTAGLLLASVASGQSGDFPEETPENAIFVAMRGPDVMRAGASAALMRKAAAEGEVRVIVELPMTLRDESGMSAAAAAIQTRTLRAAQDSLLTRVLGAARRDDERVVRFTFIPFVSIFVGADQLTRLFVDPQAVSITEDMAHAPMLKDSVPLIKADKLWAKGFNGNGYSVAVLDSGVDLLHPVFDYGATIVAGGCFSTNAPPNVSSVCPGGKTEATTKDSGKSCNSSITGCDHGTHVASIAAGRFFAGIGESGVARRSTIVSIQVMSRVNSANGDCQKNKLTPPCGLIYDTDVIRGLERTYALRKDKKIAVVNMSLGGGKFGEFCDVSQPGYAQSIGKLLDAGIPTVIASGNSKYSGFMASPACISKAVTVGATDKSDVIAGFSNHAREVKLMAPGVAITAAVPSGVGVKDGTSMAAPHVAGAFAVLKDAKPTARVDQILAALACTGKSVSRNGFAPKPRIDLLQAYNFLTNPPAGATTFNFSAQSEANSWQPLLGGWSISGGQVYRPAAGDGKTHVSLLKQAQCNGSATIQTRVKRANAGGGAYGFEGFIYKASFGNPAGTSPTASGYLAFVTNNYGNNDIAGIVRLTSHRLSDNALSFNDTSFRLICYDNTPNNNFGDWNALKVVHAGGNHSLYLNGVLACKVFDFGYFGNRVALFSAPQSNVNDSVTFDSFKVTPNDQALPK